MTQNSSFTPGETLTPLGEALQRARELVAWAEQSGPVDGVDRDDVPEMAAVRDNTLLVCREFLALYALSERKESWPFEAIACVERGQIMWEPGKRPNDGVLLYISNAAPQAPETEPAATHSGRSPAEAAFLDQFPAHGSAESLQFDKQELQSFISKCIYDSFSIKVTGGDKAIWKCPHCGMHDYDGHEQSCVIRVMAERIVELSLPSAREDIIEECAKAVESAECLPACDSYGHAEFCPLVYPEAAIRALKKSQYVKE